MDLNFFLCYMVDMWFNFWFVLGNWTLQFSQSTAPELWGRRLQPHVLVHERHSLVQNLHLDITFLYLERDKCYPYPCENNGDCIDHGTHYECRCPRGFKGINCEGTTSQFFLGLVHMSPANREVPDTNALVDTYEIKFV